MPRSPFPGRAARARAWLTATVVTLACGQKDPEDTAGATGSAAAESADAGTGGTGGTGGSGEPGARDSHFPLVAGARWTYRHQDALGQTWVEDIAMAEVDYMGSPAIQMDNTDDVEDPTSQDTVSILAVEGTSVYRIHKDVSASGMHLSSVDYDPGFVRFDEAWADQPGLIETREYERTETQGTAPATVEIRRHQFEIKAVNVTIDVPAGTFTTVDIVRTRLDTGETTRHWYAAGVGKVKEQNVTSGSIEELQSFSIP